MIIVHLADLHLGYRAYSRTTSAGVNQREADVAAAFDAATRAVVELRPDLIVVAGDVFHSVRPSNAAIADAFRKFSFLSAQLPDVPIVIVAGDRDTPRSADSASILDLFGEIPRVVVATRAVERFRFAAIDAEVVAMPYAAVASGARPLPASPMDAAVRVLVAHAGFSGPRAGLLLQPDKDEGTASLAEETIEFGRWTYVAFGHYGMTTELAPNAWYAGSIERTSADLWSSPDAPRGFLSYDTETAAAQLHAVSTRAVVDLPRISARGLAPSQVSDAIRKVLAEVPGGIADRIVRLTITDISRADLRRLDPGLLREARASALHFLLDARPPDAPRTTAAALPVRGVTLEHQVEEFLGRVWQPSMEGIERSRLVELAQRYLMAADEGTES